VHVLLPARGRVASASEREREHLICTDIAGFKLAAGRPSLAGAFVIEALVVNDIPKVVAFVGLPAPNLVVSDGLVLVINAYVTCLHKEGVYIKKGNAAKDGSDKPQ
jgi:hypothetical protein